MMAMYSLAKRINPFTLTNVKVTIVAQVDCIMAWYCID